MDYEQLINRYFELDELLKNKPSNLSEIEFNKLKAEHDKLYSDFFNTFMIVRIKLKLDPNLKCQDWLRKERDQILEHKRFLAELDDTLGE